MNKKQEKKEAVITKEMASKKAIRMLTNARVSLISTQPFFAPILVTLNNVEIFSEHIPTMGTNGVSLFYNPFFVISLKPNELLFVIAHEIMHIVLFHMTRIGIRDPFIWNLAGDFAINPMVKAMTPFPMPKSALYDEAYLDMNSEEIYDDIIKNKITFIQIERDLEAKGEGRPGKVLPYPGTDSDGNIQTTEEYENNLKEKVKSSIEKAKQAGSMPGDLIEKLSNLVKSKINWKAVLNQFLEPCKTEYSWSRPNRRFIHAGLYLPAKYGEAVGEIAFVVDTSGSVGEKEHEQFMSEFLTIINNCRPTKLYYLQIDTAIAFEKIYTEEDYPLREIPVIHGGGGTAFSPAFEYFKNDATDLQCLLYMTDLYSNDFGPRPNYPVLWINTSVNDESAKKVPWGTVIDLEVSGVQ